MNKIVLIVFVLVLYRIPAQGAEPNLRLWNSQTENYDTVTETPANFDKNANAVVIIHGVGGDVDSEDYNIFAKRIKKIEPKTNILAIDWAGIQKDETDKNYQKLQDGTLAVADLIDGDSQKDTWKSEITDWVKWSIRWGKPLKKPFVPLLSSSAIPKVSDWAYRKLFDPCGTGEGLGIKYTQTHIIGFSHGSHIAALIGKRTKGQVQHITLLDPSTSKTHLLTWENLLGKGWTAQQSALFVDMYKTSRWAGTHYARGDKSFFVRQKDLPINDNWVPSVDEIKKDHYYAFFWYLSTIGSNDKEFGYSIEVPEEHKPADKDWTGSIVSTLPRDGGLQAVDKPVENKLIP